MDSTRGRFALSATSSLLLWLAQAPLGLWAFAMVSLVPLIPIVTSKAKFTTQDFLIVWLASSVYWFVSLQGLRHAHPLMILCLFALASYLGIYFPLFIGVCRHALTLRVPLVVSVPVIWVGLEWVRNYLFTGISAAMLGHSLASVPAMIQISDLFGSYGVSFVIASVNIAIFEIIFSIQASDRFQAVKRKEAILSNIFACLCVASTLGYGQYRLNSALGEPLATFALIQRDEAVEYEQNIEREYEIFSNYARQSMLALEQTDQAVDVVVWPESMFTGGLPWMMVDSDLEIPPGFTGTIQEFKSMVADNQGYFRQRAVDVGRILKSANSSGPTPEMIVGCGVVKYGHVPQVFSGIVHLSADSNVVDWYGKNHLVMFGEYVPLLPWIPLLRNLVPPGLGVTAGSGASPLHVGETTVLPCICIETAVERVVVRHLAELKSQERDADVLLTVTNDGWFDDSSVIEHHLRCAQFIAAGTRRPLISSANNGPTAWIDSCGRIVDRLPTGTDGAIIATPLKDSRESLYVAIGDWPARTLGLFCIALMIHYSVNTRAQLRRAKLNSIEVSTE